MSQNVFDVNKKEISILVHTESILDDPKSLDFFCSARKMLPITIYFMPITHSEKTFFLTTGKYVQQQDGNTTCVSLAFLQCAVHVCSFQETDREENLKSYAERAEEHILSGRFSSTLFDYIVTNQPNTVVENPKALLVDAHQCKEILRLFLIHSKQYLITEYLSIDEFGYYLYKHREVFSEFQNYWSAVCSVGITDDWANALDNRLKLMTLCMDSCMIEANKTQNNQTAMHLQYHVAYLLLLVTGTFDNLAWIINKQYELNLTKFDVDLRRGKFHEAIKCVSHAIYQIITDDQFITEIEAIRVLRDHVVHREFIQYVTGGDGKRQPRNSYLFIDRAVCDLLLKAGFVPDRHAHITGNNACIPFKGFVEFIREMIVRIVNTIIKVIAEEKYNSSKAYVIWKVFNFPTKPYIL